MSRNVHPPNPSCLKRPFYYLLTANSLQMVLFLKMEAEYDNIIKKKTLFRNTISYRHNVTVKSATHIVSHVVTHEVYHIAKKLIISHYDKVFRASVITSHLWYWIYNHKHHTTSLGIWQANLLEILTRIWYYLNYLPSIFYSNQVLTVIIISISILSQINETNSLHNKYTLKTITNYTSRLTISHLTFHTSDLKVKGDIIRSRTIHVFYLMA
jgi:hypothetical protein